MPQVMVFVNLPSFAKCWTICIDLSQTSLSVDVLQSRLNPVLAELPLKIPPVILVDTPQGFVNILFLKDRGQTVELFKIDGLSEVSPPSEDSLPAVDENPSHSKAPPISDSTVSKRPQSRKFSESKLQASAKSSLRNSASKTLNKGTWSGKLLGNSEAEKFFKGVNGHRDAEVLEPVQTYGLRIVLDDSPGVQRTLNALHQRVKESNGKLLKAGKERGQWDPRKLRAMDVAYLFAEPLAQLASNNRFARKEVSYLREYQKFVKEIKVGGLVQEVHSDVRVVMMVATLANLDKCLSEGTFILHFACHGKPESLLIEYDQTDDLFGFECNLMKEKLVDKLREHHYHKPELIIFNACYSEAIAKQVRDDLQISTIGYAMPALGNCCEYLAEQIYPKIYERSIALVPLFDQIKKEVTEKWPEEGPKLKLFPSDTHQLEAEAIRKAEQAKSPAESPSPAE